MVRDLTMIFSVIVSLVSLGFGVYKNVEAGNARGFAYEQAYRVMGIVNEANIGPAAKASILDASLAALGTPPPVIDLSRSSADAPVPAGACSEAHKRTCVRLAEELAALNTSCMQPGATEETCALADAAKDAVDAQTCITCFAY